MIQLTQNMVAINMELQGSIHFKAIAGKLLPFPGL